MRINLAVPFLVVGCLLAVGLGFVTASLPGGPMLGILGGLVLLVVAALLIQARWDARDPAATAAVERHVDEVLTRVLGEELDELEAAIQHLPRTATYDSPYDDAAGIIRSARSAVDPDIRRRLVDKEDRTITRTVAEVADARRRIDELLQRGDDGLLGRGDDGGRRRYALGPCFADPRHGQASEPGQEVTLPDRTTAKVPLCSGCAERVRVGLAPEYRMIEDGTPAPYWTLGPVTHPYVNGYWGRTTYPLRKVQLERHLDPATAAALSGGGRRVRFYFSVSSQATEGQRRR